MKVEYLNGYTNESNDIDRACKMMRGRAKAAWSDTITGICGQHSDVTDPDEKAKKIADDISAAALAYRDLCNAELAQGSEPPQPTSAAFPSWVYTRIQRDVAWELHGCAMLIGLGRGDCGFKEATDECET